MNLPDGTYDVTIVVWNNTANTSMTTTGTVTISNGVGTVSINSIFPTGMAGDQGPVQVQVNYGTVSGPARSSISY